MCLPDRRSLISTQAMQSSVEPLLESQVSLLMFHHASYSVPCVPSFVYAQHRTRSTLESTLASKSTPQHDGDSDRCVMTDGRTDELFLAQVLFLGWPFCYPAFLFRRRQLFPHARGTTEKCPAKQQRSPSGQPGQGSSYLLGLHPRPRCCHVKLVIRCFIPFVFIFFLSQHWKRRLRDETTRRRGGPRPTNTLPPPRTYRDRSATSGSHERPSPPGPLAGAGPKQGGTTEREPCSAAPAPSAAAGRLAHAHAMPCRSRPG